MEYPADLRYTREHEWARIEDGIARIGITDFAQDALGDVVFVQLPEVGATVVKDEPFGEVESTKSVSDLYSPFSGEVVAVNDELEGAPELVNQDPYGEGWMAEIRLEDPTDADETLDVREYQDYLAESS